MTGRTQQRSALPALPVTKCVICSITASPMTCVMLRQAQDQSEDLNHTRVLERKYFHYHGSIFGGEHKGKAQSSLKDMKLKSTLHWSWEKIRKCYSRIQHHKANRQYPNKNV